MSRAHWNVRLRKSLARLGLAAVLAGLALAAVVVGCDDETVESSTTTLAAATTTTTALPSPFDDVSASHAYYSQIADLAARGIIGGFKDGSFKPDARVTRQQFAKMIVLTLGYPVSEDDVCTFQDVEDSGSDSLYPDNYVAVCAAQGITKGKTLTHFAPGENLTRAQLITMVARAADLPEAPSGYTVPFRDFSTVHYPWAKKAYHSGLLDGLEEFEPGHVGVYDFWAYATRAEASVLLHNLLHRDTGDE